jgi:hypothetical protein
VESFVDAVASTNAIESLHAIGILECNGAVDDDLKRTILDERRKNESLQGLERSADSSGNARIEDSGGAESGAVGARDGFDDPRLAVVTQAWVTLPETVMASIVAMVAKGPA